MSYQYHYKGFSIKDPNFSKEASKFLEGKTEEEIKEILSVGEAFCKACEFLEIEKPELFLVKRTEFERLSIRSWKEEYFGCYQASTNQVFLNVDSPHITATLMHELYHAKQARDGEYFGCDHDENENNCELFAQWACKEWYEIDYEPVLNDNHKDYCIPFASIYGTYYVQKSGNILIYRNIYGTPIGSRYCY